MCWALSSSLHMVLNSDKRKKRYYASIQNDNSTRLQLPLLETLFTRLRKDAGSGEFPATLASLMKHMEKNGKRKGFVSL